MSQFFKFNPSIPELISNFSLSKSNSKRNVNYMLP